VLLDSETSSGGSMVVEETNKQEMGRGSEAKFVLMWWMLAFFSLLFVKQGFFKA